MITSGGTATLGLYDNASAIKKKADITYVDSMVASIAGGHKGYATLALATAASSGIPADTVLEVTNDPTTNNNGIYLWNGSTLTKSTFDPLTLAKAYADANPMFKPVPIVAGNNINTFTANGTYTLSANLPSGQLTNHAVDSGGFHQSGVYFVQGVTISGIRLVTQIFFPYVNNYPIKVRRQINSSGTFEATWSTISTLEQLQNVFSTKGEIFQPSVTSFNALLENKYFGKSFTPQEMAGTTSYSSGYYVGFNSISGAEGSVFNKIKARLYSTSGGDTQYRIYYGNSVTTNANGNIVTAANQASFAYSGVTKSFPTTNGGSAEEIELDQVIAIPPSTNFVIVFRKATLSLMGIGYHNVAATGNLQARGFSLSTSPVDWGVSNINPTSLPNFTQAGFQLLLELPSQQNNYTPNVVLPPKIYTLGGLQYHIYPESVVMEDYKLYEHNVTCSKGTQRVRGWLYSPSTGEASTITNFNWDIHNKSSGDFISGANSSLILADLSAYSGVTKTVCVIGDSLVNDGSITQRLLDIDATDVMNLQLIGTRGTFPNLHEGRGGWTISDYTGAGRTYYRFTVSGVTVTPAINSTTYTYGGSTFLVQETSISGGSGTITCSLSSGSAPTNGSSGTLTKSNTGTGDTTIAFSDVQSQSGNPFWDGSSINFSNYLSSNTFTTPDVVFIQLGVNDTFSMTTDVAVDVFTSTAFTNLDTLINSIKAAGVNIKVCVVAPPCYASQDAFGINYANGQTAWRAKRNIVRYNTNLYNYYSGKEAQRIYVCGAGANVDSENNYPTGVSQVNSHNTNTVTIQTNGVHPATSGYNQIGDSLFAFIKAV